jgi:hypothetical protein
MTKTEALKAIDKAFYRLERCCESSHDWDRYLALIEQEEKGHRKFCPDGIDCGLTKAQSVRLFAVKEVFDRFIPNESSNTFTPEAKDYFSIKGSVFGACAIVELKRAAIRNEFTDCEMIDWLHGIDYAKLNKDPRLQAA